ncbi:MAG: hypothetical protein JWR69_2461 [Pedosphaera sp.]|nr:hypothetical protein [Pedosphaera sp.]
MLALGAWLWHRARNTPSGSATREISDQTAAAATSTVTTVPVLSPPTSSPSTPLVGETILRDFANPNLPPENDLTLISRLMDNFTLLVKSARDHPLSANEDWAAMLRGLNPGHERFLPDHHVALNAQGQLVDRWGTPLFFHALGGQHFEIRSAGPDKKLWTEDDVHRNADGSFLRGAQLNPPSLLDSTRSPAR